MIKIAVLNQSTVVKDADVQACAAALQIQISRDFAPAWDIDAEVVFIPGIQTVQGGIEGTAVPAGAWQLVILDDSDQADALGYHELTAAGMPLGKVFAGSDIADGASWQVTASHELLEMLADPNINDVTELDNSDGTITFYAKEVCDAVEADALGYEIQLPAPSGELIWVSDFVTPAWFVANAMGKVDFMGRIANPFQLAPGGYISIFKVPSSAIGWTQITARVMADEMGSVPGGPAPRTGDRRYRRALPDTQWRRSTR